MIKLHNVMTVYDQSVNIKTFLTVTFSLFYSQFYHITLKSKMVIVYRDRFNIMLVCYTLGDT